MIIGPEYASDILNVDVTPGGKSFKKRPGYGVYKALGTSQALHGGYHAFDSTGNDYQLWGTSTSLYGIVAGATPTQLVSSATLNSTWDCTDTQGSSYCVDSNRDAYIKTAGASITWYTSPLGTMVESTPDRVIVAGVSGSPNTLYVSQSNTFTNFVVGVGATDAFNEVIASPGSKLTHIRYGCGKLLWWKDQSFGYFDFDNQFQAQVKTVSDTIGTFDNTSAIDPGGRVWFRGQDGHTWMYDCSALTKQSIDITPNVQVAGKRISNSWAQTSQSDFQTGSGVPSANISFTISPADVTISSRQIVENSNTQWNSGTASNVTVWASSITLSTNNSGNVDNNSFDTAGGTAQDVSQWTRTTNSGPNVSRTTFLSWGSTCLSAPTTPKSGAGALGAIVGTTSGVSRSVSILLASDNSTLTTTSIPSAKACADWNSSVTLSAGSNLGKRVRLKFTAIDGNGTNTLTQDTSFILGGDITIFYIKELDNSATGSDCYFDDITSGSSTITTGTFTSQVYNTGLTSATYQMNAFSYSANTTTPTFTVQTSSASPGTFTTLLSATGTNAVGNKFMRYVVTFPTIGASDSATSSFTSDTIIARSSGSYFSAVHNAPNLTSWGTLTGSVQNNGGSHAFFVRAATNSFTVTSTTPSWTSTGLGSLIASSTGTYFQVRDDFAITTATDTPTLSDFTANWSEGSSADQAYMIYFDNAIWESVAFGAGQSTNNYIFKYDLINEGWTLYSFGAGGLLVQSNTLYFGDTSTGANVFNYGTSTSDNGTAIQSFWRSKSYTGSDPFLQTSLTNIDIFAKKDQGTTLTATYTTDTSTATTYSVGLSTSNAIVQSRKLLSAGKLGYTWDLKLGDTSTSSAWEILGYRIGFAQQPYRPTQ